MQEILIIVILAPEELKNTMEIIILLAILRMMIVLDWLTCQEVRHCLLSEGVICSGDKSNIFLVRGDLVWAVKFVIRVNNLLNYIVLVVAQKATQTTFIQSQNLKFEG